MDPGPSRLASWALLQPQKPFVTAGARAPRPPHTLGFRTPRPHAAGESVAAEEKPPAAKAPGVISARQVCEHQVTERVPRPLRPRARFPEMTSLFSPPALLPSMWGRYLRAIPSHPQTFLPGPCFPVQSVVQPLLFFPSGQESWAARTQAFLLPSHPPLLGPTLVPSPLLVWSLRLGSLAVLLRLFAQPGV